MSGTSYDGVDVAAAEFTVDGDTLRAASAGARQPGPRRRAAGGDRRAAAAGRRPRSRRSAGWTPGSAQAFAEAAARGVELAGGRADLVVSHGQTVFHWVDGRPGARAPCSSGSRPGSPSARASRCSSDLRSRGRRRRRAGRAAGQPLRRAAARGRPGRPGPRSTSAASPTSPWSRRARRPRVRHRPGQRAARRGGPAADLGRAGDHDGTARAAARAGRPGCWSCCWPSRTTPRRRRSRPARSCSTPAT